MSLDNHGSRTSKQASTYPTLRANYFPEITDYCRLLQGIANNTKGTASVVYEGVMDAKVAGDKLNGFNFQNR
ncbi:uncharacterized protein PAC_03990 [Phialocephala subalpina]|uniref:Uncharacterized protein n=1 Tax=Phialocephala subalpina TaxID=576137 RepID=A0A1L7WMU8_9HELO|nr:uncharacterized protein PAC_03990 [Phialocephala subalpina]